MAFEDYLDAKRVFGVRRHLLTGGGGAGDTGGAVAELRRQQLVAFRRAAAGAVSSPGSHPLSAATHSPRVSLDKSLDKNTVACDNGMKCLREIEARVMDLYRADWFHPRWLGRISD